MELIYGIQYCTLYIFVEKIKFIYGLTSFEFQSFLMWDAYKILIYSAKKDGRYIMRMTRFRLNLCDRNPPFLFRDCFKHLLIYVYDTIKKCLLYIVIKYLRQPMCMTCMEEYFFIKEKAKIRLVDTSWEFYMSAW